MSRKSIMLKMILTKSGWKRAGLIKRAGTSLLPMVGKIEIGNNVFIGANATVMPGVKIGNNCVVAAGAVLTRSIPDGEIWGGVPAKKIGLYEELKKKCTAYNNDFREKTKNMNVSLYDKQIKYFWKD